MRVVNLPEMEYEGMTAPEALTKFYADLGWNPEKQILDPTKVKLSETDHTAFTEKLDLLQPNDISGVHMMLLNRGPSCYTKVTDGKVHLFAGWVRTE